MARPKGQLRLGAFFNPTGHHVASWRHPGAQADAGINFKHYVEIAQTAERDKFDMIFLADNICVREANMEALRQGLAGGNQTISDLTASTDLLTQARNNRLALEQSITADRLALNVALAQPVDHDIEITRRDASLPAQPPGRTTNHHHMRPSPELFGGQMGETGAIHAARGGTLLLEEVGDLPFRLQAKLSESRVGVRLSIDMSHGQ